MTPSDSDFTEPDPPALDGGAMQAARTALRDLPQLGRLRDLAVWVAGAQGAAPPQPFRAPVALVAAAVHDSGRYVRQDATSPVPQRLSAVASESVRLRVLDLSTPGDWFVRMSAGPIAREDAMTEEETLRAFALGRLAVEQEVDGGADVLLAGHIAGDDAACVAALASVLTGAEPAKVVRRGPDAGPWMRTVEVVRDSRHRAKTLAAQPISLLAAVGGPDLAALAGVLVQAAERRTPVLLDGPAAHVAALVARIYSRGARPWWASASASGDPAESAAVEGLGLDPVLRLDLGLDACGNALLAYPIVQAGLALAATA